MSSWPGVIALLVAMMVALVAQRALGIGREPGHNMALDGLRGFLAFGVFLHHGVVWYYYLHDGSWGLPPLKIYRELGLDCVNFFFMITAFLFTGKVIDGRRKPVDWVRLYVGRFLRIAPLYLLVAIALLMAVGRSTGWRLQEPAPVLLLHGLQWLALGMGGMPAVNGLSTTGMLIAFVTWTLAYEWLFYFSLPLIALVLGARVKPWLLLASIAAMVLVTMGITSPFFPSAFVFGIGVAFISRQERLTAVLRKPAVSVVALLAVAVLLSGDLPHRIVMLFEVVAFCIVACGNDLFGLLSNRAAVALGEASYGIYLVHSLLLSSVILFLLGPDAARGLSPVAFWGLLTTLGAGVTLLSTLTFRFIEKPMLGRASGLALWLRQLGAKEITA